MSRRSRAIDLYLKAGIEEDDLVFAIWTALHGTGRPQDVFRRALRIGLRMLAETGELPRAALQQAESGLLGPPAPAMAFLLRGMAAAARAPAAAPQRAPRAAPALIHATAEPPPQKNASPDAAVGYPCRVVPQETGGGAPAPGPAAPVPAAGRDSPEPGARRPRLGKLM